MITSAKNKAPRGSGAVTTGAESTRARTKSVHPSLCGSLLFTLCVASCGGSESPPDGNGAGHESTSGTGGANGSTSTSTGGVGGAGGAGGASGSTSTSTGGTSTSTGGAGGGSAVTNDGIAVIGKARFTVVTPTLIRVEYDEAKAFLDLPTYFAVGREARYQHAKIDVTDKGVTIDTGALKLAYVDDGTPFSEHNLSAELRANGSAQTFYPTAPNRDNLGGTTRTLDQWRGAGQLEDGIVSRAGHYVVDDSERHILEDGWIHERTKPERDLYVFGYGHDYRAALSSLTAIGGAVPMPRRYVLGSWYSRYWPYSEADFKGIVQEYDDHDFPLDVVVLDMDWHLDGWTGWSWNPKLITDPASLMKFFHDRGLATTVNIHPADGVAPYETAYGSFMQALGQDPALGKTVAFDAANQSYMSALFNTVHAPLDAVGVDFYWLDWQQSEFTRSLPHLQNIAWLNEQYFRYTSKDEKRGVSFSRWGGLGDHRHPIHFSGDASTDFAMLAFEVPFTATSGNSGLFFWSHDIGGHTGPRNEESYTRWCQFGALSAALRSHSARNVALDRRPWTYADWANASMQKSFALRSRLFPYIYSAVWQSSHDSVPLLRPMYFDAPDDDVAYRQPQEYWFGDNLLVAPIAEAGTGPRRLGRQAVWFPQGTFYDFTTGERFDGPSEHLVARTIDEVPLFARAGVPIAMQAFTRRMATTPTSELTVRCYPGEDGSTGTSELHEDDGTSTAYTKGELATTALTCSRHGDDITVTIAPTKGTYQGQLATRSYLIEIPATQAATSATVDGASKPSTYAANEAINRVKVDARAITQATSVTLHAPLMDPTECRRRAFAARVGIDAATGGTLEAMLAVAWSQASGDAEKMGVLAAAGSGVFPKNEKLYGNPYLPKLTAYQEPWAKVDVKVSETWSEVMLNEQATVTFGGQTIHLTGPLLGLDFAHPGKNLATLATATFSSTEYGDTVGLADQKVGGYPGVRAEEWSTNKEGSGAWATLAWSTPQTVSKVVLFDRINTADQITSGELAFDDGSIVPVGAVPNEPTQGPLVVSFPARKARSMTFRVKSVSATTENVGLSELAVY